MKISLNILFVVSLFSSASGRAWNIYGEDQRTSLASKEYPYSAIGYLNSRCTATLIGRDLVLTASHCVRPPRGQRLIFFPGYSNGKAEAFSAVKKIYRGTSRSVTEREMDWAILKLHLPLGDRVGWMDPVKGEFDEFSLAGYSLDFHQGTIASLVEKCTVRKRTERFLLHDCDCARGTSGGPMFQIVKGRAKLYGIEVAEYRKDRKESLVLEEYSDEYANIGIATEKFWKKYQELVDVE